MSNPTPPYELIAAPFTVYTAALGTAFPSLDDEFPVTGWTRLGAAGERSITHAGVQVSHDSSYVSAPFVLPGATAPSRTVRVAESLTVSFALADMTAEAYAAALNGSIVQTIPPGVGTVGFKTLTLLNGTEVEELALLVRGEVSPYMATGRSQYELPRATQTAPPMPLFVKSEPAGLLFRFRALRDPVLGYGLLRVQDEPAT